MSKQFIVAIGREFGSGGKHIGRALAKRLNVNLYDRNIVEKVAAEMEVDADHLKKYEEKKRRPLFHRSVAGHTTALEDHVAELQFGYIKRLAESGESFVIVGRCAEDVLRGREGLITIFITGDREYKIRRVMKQFSLSRAAAIEKMDRHDRTRKAYHNHYSSGKWGDAKNYDLVISSSHLGTEGTAEFIADYIERRIKAAE